jgi:TrmH RNA methyltransferase
VVSGLDTEARLTTSARRVAEGGAEHVTLRSVRDTAAFVRDISRFMVTICADHRARPRISDLPDAVREKRAEGAKAGIALVMGNEEAGLPQDVKDACDLRLRIPGTGLMESLNVAQAASIFLHAIYEGC